MLQPLLVATASAAVAVSAVVVAAALLGVHVISSGQIFMKQSVAWIK